LEGLEGEKLQQDGDEFGATTGRPRRCGWFDAVGLRYAARVNGMTGLALTKLDVLTGFKKIRISTAYRSGGELYHEFPASLSVLEKAEPVWEELEGWETPLSGARKFSDLPPATQRYVRRLEDVVETEIILVSVGPGREQTIILKDPFSS
jgi:adenylosuccinate synthase